MCFVEKVLKSVKYFIYKMCSEESDDVLEMDWIILWFVCFLYVVDYLGCCLDDCWVLLINCVCVVIFEFVLINVLLKLSFLGWDLWKVIEVFNCIFVGKVWWVVRKCCVFLLVFWFICVLCCGWGVGGCVLWVICFFVDCSEDLFGVGSLVVFF